MNYEILDGNGEVIAKFVKEYDRDTCFDHLNEQFEDAGLSKN